MHMLRYLPAANARQLGIIVGCVSGGIVRYILQFCQSLMDAHIRVAYCLAPLSPRAFLALASCVTVHPHGIHQPIVLTSVSRSSRCATAIILVHAGTQRKMKLQQSTTEAPALCPRSALPFALNPGLSTLMHGYCMIARGGGQ